MKTIEIAEGVNMPVVGLGTFLANGDDLELSVEAALEAGYRHIDTASFYENKHIIGKVITKWFESGKISRDELFITTKLPPIGMRPNRVEQFLTKSLEELGIDYVDLYLIHVPFAFNYREGVQSPHRPDGYIDLDLTTDHIAIWKTMEKMQEKGLTKSIGVSNFTISQIQGILDNCTIRPVMNQIEVNLYLQQDELADFCKENNISITAYSPLGSPGLGTFLTAFGKEKSDVPSILFNPTVVKIADKHDKCPAQVLLKQLLQRGFIVIPKSTNPERLKQNIDVFDFTLDEEDMAELKKLNKNIRVLDFSNFKGVEEHPEYPF